MENKTLYIVVPCYNEQEVLDSTSKELKSIIDGLIQKGKISCNSKVFFINDGSKDKTWEMIKDLNSSDPTFSGISLSRNKGHQNALLAGLSVAVEHADMFISIDADLQDDPVCIEMMVDKYLQGYEVVSGVRKNRSKDTFFKRFTAQTYYKVMKWMGVDLIYNSADCRLLSKKACKSLLSFKEVNLFLRGLVPLIGYKSTTVEYNRNPRLAGESKYGLKQMLALAGQGITSFSFKPIKFIRNFGLFFLFSGLLTSILVGCLYQPYDLYYLIGVLIPVGIMLLGVAMLTIYIIGEYIGKIYLEVKERPKFFIDENLENEDSK